MIALESIGTNCQAVIYMVVGVLLFIFSQDYEKSREGQGLRQFFDAFAVATGIVVRGCRVACDGYNLMKYN